MKKACCLLSVIPVRAEATHRSEQITQLLFGDDVEINDEKGDWYFVRNLYDSYEGWVQKRQLGYKQNDDVESDWVNVKPVYLGQPDGSRLLIPAGCSVNPLNNPVDDPSAVKKTGQGNFSDEISRLAMSFLGTPYQWGGRTHFGIDCSGFVQIVYKMMGILLPRDAWQQAGEGHIVHFVQEAKSGDLAFFDNEEGYITHVGIMLGNETIIHASASVRIERVDGQGIYAEDLKAYSHKLRIIKRLVEKAGDTCL